jgi:hypothetical protein
MIKAMGRTETTPVSSRTEDVPEPIAELDKTRELSAVADSEPASPPATSAAPQQVIPIEETVPVQSCIERTLLQEVLRRESAENDEDRETEK